MTAIPGSEPGRTSAETATRYVSSLTRRQRQIFEMVVAGRPSKIIAADIGISQRTVEKHRQAIMEKTHARTLPELVRLALAARLFSAADPFCVNAEIDFPLDVEPITAVARAIFEHTPAAMVIVDLTGMMLHLNPAGEQLFGYLEAELLGKPIETLLPGSIRGQHKQLREGFIQAPAARSMGGGRELAARHKDGHEITVDIELRPLNAGGRPVIVLLSIIDRSAGERLERAELLVQELTHRARNMLAVILAISR